MIVPFLDALQSVVTDSEAVADHAAKSCRVHTEENINILLNDPQIIEQIRKLCVDKILIFEIFFKHILKVDDAAFDCLIQVLLKTCAPELTDNQSDFYRLEAVQSLAKLLKLNVSLPSNQGFLEKLNTIGQNITEKKQKLNKLDANSKTLEQLIQVRAQIFNRQRAIFERVATWYVGGSADHGLSKHNQSRFEKIFSPYLNFNNGQPRLADEYQPNTLIFDELLPEIISKCEQTTKHWLDKNLYHGAKTIEILVNEAKAEAQDPESQRLCAELKTACVAAEKILASKSPNFTPLPSLMPLEHADNLSIKLHYFQEEDDKRQNTLNLELQSLEKERNTLSQFIDKAIEIVKHAYQELLDKIKKRVCPDYSYDRKITIDDKLTADATNDLAIVIKHIANISNNEDLTKIHNILAKRDYLTKHTSGADCKTTMSGTARSCSAEWQKIEQTFACKMFSNEIKNSGDENCRANKLSELIKSNPFLQKYEGLVNHLLIDSAQTGLFCKTLTELALNREKIMNDILFPSHPSVIR
ncbi:hypothetical protein AVI50_07845 [Piscirickettsia salmonis]|nr:hypothetical protein AVI50_07845 [Piscirickettsia salmonis]